MIGTADHSTQEHAVGFGAKRKTNGRKLEKGTARTKAISLLGGLSTQKTQQGRQKKNKKKHLGGDDAHGGRGDLGTSQVLQLSHAGREV